MVQPEGAECIKPYDGSDPAVRREGAKPRASRSVGRSGRAAGWEMSNGRAERLDRPSRARQDSTPEAVRVWLLGGFWVSVGSQSIEQDQWGAPEGSQPGQTSCHRARSSQSPRADDEPAVAGSWEKGCVEQPPPGSPRRP